jgi:hypothetical protein
VKKVVSSKPTSKIILKLSAPLLVKFSNPLELPPKSLIDKATSNFFSVSLAESILKTIFSFLQAFNSIVNICGKSLFNYKGTKLVSSINYKPKIILVS